MTVPDISIQQRGALRAAIEERDTRKNAVRQASEIKARAELLMREARAKLQAFGDVDGAIKEHRAASFRNAAQEGARPSLALPDDLIRKERARDEAATAVSAARAAHQSLVGELAEAQAELRRAESSVSDLAAATIVAEASELGANLNEIWNGLWATIDALHALRSALGVPLPPPVAATLQSFMAMDYRQFPGGRNAQLAANVVRWRKYRLALCQSADATEADDQDQETPPLDQRVA